MLRLLPFPPDLTLGLTEPPPAPPPEVIEAVQRIWRREKALRPALFDGKTFSLLGFDGPVALGWLAPYSWRLARLRNPELCGHLRLACVDVSCLSTVSGKVVFGRRRADLAVEGGLWELCPSGSIHGGLLTPEGQPDFRAHAAEEAREELGVSIDPARVGQPFALVQNTATSGLDIGLHLPLPVSAAELAHLHRTRSDGEYDQLALVPAAQAWDFALSHGQNLAPVSLELLAAFGLARPLR